MDSKLNFTITFLLKLSVLPLSHQYLLLQLVGQQEAIELEHCMKEVVQVLKVVARMQNLEHQVNTMLRSYLDLVHSFEDSLTLVEELALPQATFMELSLPQATFMEPYSFKKDLNQDSQVSFDTVAFLVELVVNLHCILVHTTKVDLPLEDFMEEFVAMVEHYWMVCIRVVLLTLV